MGDVIQSVGTVQRHSTESGKVPQNILLFIAYAMALTQDTQTAQRRENQSTTITIALMQAETVMSLFKRDADKPIEEWGILAYFPALIDKLTTEFDSISSALKAAQEKGNKSEINRLQSELKKKAGELNEAQSQYQAANTFSNSVTNDMGSTLQKMQTAVKNDDNNLTQMTNNVKVLMSLVDFTRQLISANKK